MQNNGPGNAGGAHAAPFCHARYATRREPILGASDAAFEPPDWVLQHSHYCPDGFVQIESQAHVQEQPALNEGGGGVDLHPRVGIGW